MNNDDVEVREVIRRVHGTWRVWLMVGIVGALGAAGIYHLRGELMTAREQAMDSDARATQRLADLQAANLAKQELDARVEALEKDMTDFLPLKEKLEAESKAKQERAGKLEAVAKTLAEKLKPEVATKDVEVAAKDTELVLVVREKLLFDAVEPVLSKRGDDVLVRVAAVLTEPDTKALFEELRVSGHLDDAPVPDKLKLAYPTPWELSAVHAAQVARVLRDKLALEDSKLSVIAYGSSRPLAPNTSAKAKHANRRVEIVWDSAAHTEAAAKDSAAKPAK
jgi:flagellar motor protein MotB